jgi:predicted deacetylase
MKKGLKKTIQLIGSILFIILILLIILVIVRLITSTEIDDVSPGIPCPEIQIYNPDTLYVIPDYQDHPLSFYSEWCKYILSLNKDLSMHGVTHTYREFLYSNISQEKLDFGKSEFEKCFAFQPTTFKPPQLVISKENKQLIEDNNLERRTVLQQITHKVYHCNDSDLISNKIIHLF